jgi:hypothetical protein
MLPVAILAITECDNKVKQFTLSAPEKLKETILGKLIPVYKEKGGMYAKKYMNNDWPNAVDIYEMIGLIEESGFILEHFSAGNGGNIRCVFRSCQRMEL